MKVLERAVRTSMRPQFAGFGTSSPHHSRTSAHTALSASCESGGADLACIGARGRARSRPRVQPAGVRVAHAGDRRSVPSGLQSWSPRSSRSSCRSAIGRPPTLPEQGLIQTVRVPGYREHAVVLTKEGRSLLEGHRNRDVERGQTFYTGLKRERELEHDLVERGEIQKRDAAYARSRYRPTSCPSTHTPLAIPRIPRPYT